MQVVSARFLAVQAQQDRHVLRAVFADCAHNSIESLDDSVELLAHDAVARKADEKRPMRAPTPIAWRRARRSEVGWHDVIRAFAVVILNGSTAVKIVAAHIQLVVDVSHISGPMWSLTTMPPDGNNPNEWVICTSDGVRRLRRLLHTPKPPNTLTA
jgi:hypothetical protein